MKTKQKNQWIQYKAIVLPIYLIICIEENKFTKSKGVESLPLFSLFPSCPVPVPTLQSLRGAKGPFGSQMAGKAARRLTMGHPSAHFARIVFVSRWKSKQNKTKSHLNNSIKSRNSTANQRRFPYLLSKRISNNKTQHSSKKNDINLKAQYLIGDWQQWSLPSF